MSKIDAYEAQRGPVRRRWRGKPKPTPKRAQKEVQLSMQLYGGSSVPKSEREPFDDPIPF